MAISSNRSPSPVPARHNPLPKTSSSEAHSAIRRSFSGSPSPKPFPLTNPRRSFNPITPANSPADSGRRVLPAKEETANSWDFPEKENEKAAKLRSPAKGSKNFMSPTISAASKFCPSPKKRVLVDRNEPVRTFTLCDGKATFFSSISSDSMENAKPKSEILQPPPVTKTMRKVSFADEVPLNCDNGSNSVVTDSDFCNIETKSKNINPCSAQSPSTTALDPLNASPSLNSYDPKINYLSPRPQFLHYRPNPRIEVLRNMEKGGEVKQLDDSFMSENSDSESQIEDSQKVSEASSSTVEEEVVEEPKKIVLEQENEETEVIEEPKFSGEEIVVEPETIETEVAEEVDCELPLPVSMPVVDEMAKEIPNGQKLRKSRFLSNSKLASVVLLIMFGCVSIFVTDSPIINGYGVKDLKLTDLSYLGSQISVLIQSTLNEHLKRLSDSPSLISDELGAMQFIKLTDLKGGSKWELEENELENDIESEELAKKVEENEVEEDVEASEIEEGTGFGDSQEVEFREKLEIDDEVEENELEFEDVGSAEASEGEDDTGFGDSQEVEFREKLEFDDEVEENALEIEDVGSAEASEGEVYTDFGDNSEVEGGQETTQVEAKPTDVQPEVDAKPADVQPEVVEVVEFHGELVTTSMDVNLESKIDDSWVEKIPSSETLESLVQTQEGSLTMLGISSLFLGTVAVSVFIFLKRKNVTPDYVALADPCSPKSLVSASMKQKDWPTEVDDFAESCSSEMSSFEASTPYSRKDVRLQTSKAQKQDRKPSKSSTRRESVAASSDCSLGSPSYGSFTTYERIPIKHGSESEELMTPVRRSSRIKSQVTSSS